MLKGKYFFYLSTDMEKINYVRNEIHLYIKYYKQMPGFPSGSKIESPPAM